MLYLNFFFILYSVPLNKSEFSLCLLLSVWAGMCMLLWRTGIMVIWKTHNKCLLRHGDSLSFRITFGYCWPTLVYEIFICVFIPVCLLTYVTVKMAPFYFQPLP